MLNVIELIYCNVRSRVKYNNNSLSYPFECNIGVRLHVPILIRNVCK